MLISAIFSAAFVSPPGFFLVFFPSTLLFKFQPSPSFVFHGVTVSTGGSGLGEELSFHAGVFWLNGAALVPGYMNKV